MHNNVNGIADDKRVSALLTEVYHYENR